MITLKDYILIYESAPDKLLDIFGENGIFMNNIKDPKILYNKIKEALAKEEISLKLTLNNQNKLDGEFDNSTKTIIIKLPHNKPAYEKFQREGKYKDYNFKKHKYYFDRDADFIAIGLLSTVFHEFVHYLKNKNKSSVFNPLPKKDTKDDILHIDVKAQEPKQIDNQYDMIHWLIYYTQPHERASFAISVAYEILQFVKSLKVEAANNLITEFEDQWIKFHKNNGNLEHLFIQNNLGTIGRFTDNENRVIAYRKTLDEFSMLSTFFVSVMMMKEVLYNSNNDNIKKKAKEISIRFELLESSIFNYCKRFMRVFYGNVLAGIDGDKIKYKHFKSEDFIDLLDPDYVVED